MSNIDPQRNALVKASGEARDSSVQLQLSSAADTTSTGRPLRPSARRCRTVEAHFFEQLVA